MSHLPTSRCALALLPAALLSPFGSPAQEPKPPDAAPAAPAAEASDKRIVYQVVPWVSGDRHTVTTTLEAVPIRARDGLPLLGESLYQELGRPDLADEFRARQARRWTIVGVGAVVTLGGLVYAATRPGPDTSMGFDAFRRAADDQQAAQTTGILVSVAGGVIMMVGGFTDPNPVGEAERHRLVEEHNRALPSGPNGGPPRSAAPGGAGQPNLSFQAGLLPGGGMAGVAVAF